MNPELSLSAIHRKRGQNLGESPVVATTPNATTTVVRSTTMHESRSAETDPASAGFSLPFDPLRVVDALYSRRWLLLFAGVVCGGVLTAVGWKRFETHYSATAQIIKQAPASAVRQSETGDPYQPHELTIPTLTALMRGAAVLEKVAARLDKRFTEGELKSGLIIVPERNTDIVRIGMTSDVNADNAVAMLTGYVEEVLTMSRDIQQRDAAEMSRFLTGQIAHADEGLLKVNEELLTYAQQEELVDIDKQMDAWLGELSGFNQKYQSTKLDHETLDLKISGIEKELSKVSPAAAKLQQARGELAQLQLRYTDEHPVIMEAMDRVKAMEAEMSTDKPKLDSPPRPGESAVAESLYLELVKLRSDKQVLGEQLGKLATVQEKLNQRLESLPRKALEYARIKSRQQSLESSRALLLARQREAAMYEENAQGAFRLLSMARPQDVVIERPTKKLIIAGIGGFVSAAGALAFLFGMLSIADGRVLTVSDLKRSTGMPVLGSLSALTPENERNWAFRTWTSLQPRLITPASGGATICGLLTNGSDEAAHLPLLLAQAAASRGLSVIVVSHGEGLATSAPLRDVIAQPEQLMRQLGESPHEIVHLVLDSEWQWTQLQRELWQTALARWSQLHATAILVQLTSPAQANTLLVAERMPNLIWVSQAQSDLVDDTQTQLGTYRAAGCRLAGAMLDHAPTFRLGLLNKLALAVACLALPCIPVSGAPVVLGPGDGVNIAAVGYPELARNGISVGPDGKLTYLQAQNIQAAGLTIDELRGALSKELRRYYKNLIVVVTPLTFQSRKVYVLGKVVKKGAINIDRPLTIVEVVAEAGGLETGLFQQNTVELADLGRSFLMRGSSRMPVDMEALFLHGDMKQNLPVEPGDYMYFPSANSNEIYVLGNVKMQGTQGLLAHTSVHSAIAQAGGFTSKAYTRRILVIRGSLDKPETFTVNLDDILNARSKTFRLQPKDIMYVADKPWARAEELLSFALNAFFQGAVSGWVGGNIEPFIKEAILPTIK